MIRGVAGCVRPVGSKLRFTIPVINPYPGRTHI